MALRIPSPVALTKPEAYLAYKAGILSRGELKDKLLNPINNYEGWLAKWCELLETYPTNKDGTPQCLTDEEGLLAYLCGVTNRYPATNSRPDDARISAYIRYLVSVRYARPDHPLNREEFYLSLIKPQFVPSGDPSSDIVLDNTTKAPFLDVKVYGDTYQTTYSGKNLQPIFSDGTISSAQTMTAGYLSLQQFYTGYGESLTSSNGTLTIQPSGTSIWKLIIAGLAASTTYTLSADYSITLSQNGNAFILGHFLSNLSGGTAHTGRQSLTFTTDADGSWQSTSGTAETLVYAYNYTTIATLTNIQLEQGSTATDYEPYVGGTPAPNPSYPQPISVVTGRQTVNVVGKNLFDGILEEGIINGNTGEDAYIAGYIRDKNYILVQEQTTYILSSPDFSGTYAVYEYKADKSYNLTTNKMTPGGVFTTEAGTKYVRFRPAGTGLTTSARFMLEKSATPTSYEPYQEQDYTIDLGSIELAKIGAYQDRIYKEGEKWYIEKNVGKQVIDGTEGTFGAVTVDTITTREVISNVLDYSSVGTIRLPISDYFIGKSMWSVDENGIYTTGKDVVIRGSKDTIGTTADSVKAWLSTHPTTVYYALATPTDTEITDQTLIDQLEALMQGGAEEGTTYIKVSATDPNLPAKLYVEAPKYD